MPSKTRSGAQSRVGRPKADPMSCATKSYKKSHPTTSLKSCSASQTCRQVPGKAGKRCTMKRKPGRVAGPKKVKPLTAKAIARGFKQLPGSMSTPAKTAKRRGRPLGAKGLMKELPQVTPAKYAPRAKELLDTLPKL
jgi:hypothetical protein